MGSKLGSRIQAHDITEAVPFYKAINLAHAVASVTKS